MIINENGNGISEWLLLEMIIILVFEQYFILKLC